MILCSDLLSRSFLWPRAFRVSRRPAAMNRSADAGTKHRSGLGKESPWHARYSRRSFQLRPKAALFSKQQPKLTSIEYQEDPRDEMTAGCLSCAETQGLGHKVQ